MVRTVKFLFLLSMAAACLNLWAQQKKPNGKPAIAKTEGSEQHKKILLPTVYLGKSDYSGGPIKTEEFNKLLKQGLTSRDSLGNKYKVLGFGFNYAERALYEDSIGNAKIMVDILYEFCPGDTITSNVSASIYERIKPGDTVYIERVTVVKYLPKSNKVQPDADAIGAKGLKCVIVK
ncbi:MAG: hypothetical protein K0Q79_3415 [Flavipsychrobacter sp.]|jgi:hypothetical protein|nr:hypothetical protein [Flavipsychrobacter sp.]